AYLRLGRFIEHVPDPVTTGFTAGIAVILGVISLNDFLGMGLDMSHGHFPEKVALLARHLADINPYAALVGIVTLALMIFGRRIIRLIPPTILGIGAGIGLSLLFARNGHPIATIASQFHYVLPNGMSGAGIPPYPPHFGLPEIPDNWVPYLYPALIIALLAALESLLAAQAADKMTGHRHHPNAELYAIGAGNIASGFFSGIPATGAIARTAALINNGATSPLASSMHALFILLYVVLLAPLIGHIPMTTLAAILIQTAWRMSHAPHFWRILRGHGYHKAGVLLATFGMTIAIDMVAGVATGLILHFGFLFAIKNKSRPYSEDQR
ncbi:MAG TPA: SulP family inorganic anion transporter, partial [Alphaproteobacteria bacterium]